MTTLLAWHAESERVGEVKRIPREHKGQRGSLAVMPLGYLNFTKSIFRNTK